jgi:hypothetical protein
MTDRADKFMHDHLNQLIGWTVDHAVTVRASMDEEPMYGLVFTRADNKKHQLFAIIQQDPEGNGPGFLSIEKEKYGT